MSPGPWSRIKRKTDHPLPSPPASIASFASSTDSSCSSSSSLNTFACRPFPEVKADSPSDESPSAIIEPNGSVTCGSGDCGLYSNAKESSPFSQCHAFQLHEELSTHRAPLLIQEQAPAERQLQAQSHLPKLDHFNLYQSNSHSRTSFHMPKSPHHQLHPASLISACEIDFGPGGTIRRKPSIHLNNPKLPLLSSTTRILANQPNEDSRVEIVPSHVMSFSYKQSADQLITNGSQCQRNHANSRSIVSRSHAFASCERDSNDQVNQVNQVNTLSTIDSVSETPQVPSLSATSRAAFSSVESAKQASDVQGQQSVSGASVTRSCSTIVRNNIQYGTLKRNNSSVNSHRIVRRVSNVPTTNRIIPFESFATGERVSLHSLNSVESSDFSSSSSSSASSVCSSSSHGTHSPSSSSSSPYAATKLSAVSAPSRPSNDSLSPIVPNVSFATSSSGGGVNFLPTLATSTSSSSSYSFNCSSCKCTRVNCTALSTQHTASNSSSDSLASSAFANPVNSFPSSTLCKSCRSETSSILSRSVSMLGEEDDQCDESTIAPDQELLSIEKCLLQLNLGHSLDAHNADKCHDDACKETCHMIASARVNDAAPVNGHSSTTCSKSELSVPLSLSHPRDGINQCHAKNSCNSENNNEHQLRGTMNNGLVCSSDQASPLHLRDSWSYAADASPDASDDEELLPPPPLDDSRIMARLSNLSLDSLPPPPPELHSLNSHSLTFGSLAKSESTYSLDSFPPPPPPPTSLPTLLEPSSVSRLASFSSSQQSASSSATVSSSGECVKTSLLPHHSGNQLVNQRHEFICRNTNNGSTRSKPAPPPPPRSESTRLSSLPLSRSSHPLSH